MKKKKKKPPPLPTIPPPTPAAAAAAAIWLLATYKIISTFLSVVPRLLPFGV
jgi:hypothetical protein